jgi:hypothetical protein
MKIKNFNYDEELNILRDNMGASLVPAIKTGHTIKYFSNDEILKLGRKYPEKKIRRTTPPGKPITDSSSINSKFNNNQYNRDFDSPKILQPEDTYSIPEKNNISLQNTVKPNIQKINTNVQNKIVHHPPKSDNHPESEIKNDDRTNSDKKVNKLSNKEILQKMLDENN